MKNKRTLWDPSILETFLDVSNKIKVAFQTSKNFNFFEIQRFKAEKLNENLCFRTENNA